MASAVARLWSDDPEADYREPVEVLLRAWRGVGAAEVADLVERAIAPQIGVDGVEYLGLVDNGVVVTPSFQSDWLGIELSIPVYLEICCLPFFSAPTSPDEPVTRVARQINVLLHPVDPRVDLSKILLLTALGIAIGERIARPGWVIAAKLAGTSWIIGIPETPPLAFGVSPQLEAAPVDEAKRVEWRKTLAARAALVQALADSLKEEVEAQ
jgi:hypothetical protein